MTETELRQRVCDKAKSWLGLCEPTSYWPIIEVYNAYAKTHGLYVMTKSDPWCAAFVSAVAIATGTESIIPPEVSCPRMVNLFAKLDEWMEDDAYIPREGDIIFYDWNDNGQGDSTGNPGHVGIVVSVEGSSISVIEGNCNDAVRLVKRTVNQRNIRGYGLPDYAKLAGDEPTPEPTPTQKTCKPTIPYLTRGDKGAAVAAAQAALNFKGYNCGYVDGDFGAATAAAVSKFKADNGMNPECTDIGKKTWTKLMK